MLYATYALDERLQVHREVNPPPLSTFVPLGFDTELGTKQKKKHYRRFVPDELENCAEYMPVKTPFHVFKLKKGQSRGASAGLFGGLFGAAKTDASGQVTTEQEMGLFKGVITVESTEEKKKYQEEKADLIHRLKVKLDQLSKKKREKPFEFKLEMMDSAEGR